MTGERAKLSYNDRNEVNRILGLDEDGVEEALYTLFADIERYGKLLADEQAQTRQQAGAIAELVAAAKALRDWDDNVGGVPFAIAMADLRDALAKAVVAHVTVDGRPTLEVRDLGQTEAWPDPEFAPRGNRADLGRPEARIVHCPRCGAQGVDFIGVCEVCCGSTEEVAP